MSLIRFNGGRTSSIPSMFSNFFDTDELREREWFDKNWVPAVNVKETDDNFQIEVAAPGLSKKDFVVTVENGVLNISAETKEETEETEDNYTRKEFSYNSFKRSFTLPESVKEEVNAKYNDGVLRLTLDKKEEAKVKPARTIDIS